MKWEHYNIYPNGYFKVKWCQIEIKFKIRRESERYPTKLLTDKNILIYPAKYYILLKK